MTKEFRNRIAAAIAAMPLASFTTFLWLFFSYVSSRPQEPHPELGLVRALNNHGARIYVSDTESTALALLMIAFVVGFVGYIAIVPKQFVLPPPGTPRWLIYVSGAAKTDLAQPSTELKTILIGSLIVCWAIIFFFGSSIAGFLVSHGICLANFVTLVTCTPAALLLAPPPQRGLHRFREQQRAFDQRAHISVGAPATPEGLQ